MVRERRWRSESRPRFLLVYPAQPYSFYWGRQLALKGILIYLQAYLSQYFDVAVVDLEWEFARPSRTRHVACYNALALDRVLSFEFDYIGISCWTSLQYLSALRITEDVKKARPQATVVVGGWHPTAVPEDFTYDGSPFDIVATGPVDSVLPALGIGTACRRSPFEIFVSLELEQYPYFKNQTTIPLFLSTGCPWSCTYCMEYNKNWNVMEADEAAEVIVRLERDYGAKLILILDPLFGLRKRWRRAFLTTLIEKEVEAFLWAESRCDLWDEEDLRLLGKLNFILDFGVDSFSETMLGIMHKQRCPRQYLDKFLKVSERCSEMGIPHGAFLIVNHPGETQQTVDEHREFLEKRVGSALDRSYLTLRMQGYAHFPGTQIYRQIHQYEKQFGTEILYPEWWKMERDHILCSRAVIPSKQDGRPFQTPFDELFEGINRFNARSHGAGTYIDIKAFNTDHAHAEEVSSPASD